MMAENQQKPTIEQDWREVPRSEMFSRVITAVDASRGEAEEVGDANWMRYCDEALFPFLEAEKEKAQAEEGEREEEFRRLTERVGASEEEARLMMRDDDLWIIGPEFRYGPELDGEAGVREWETVAHLAQAFSELVTNHIDRRSHAATQLAHDAAVRADEALRRARARLAASE